VGGEDGGGKFGSWISARPGPPNLLFSRVPGAPGQRRGGRTSPGAIGPTRTRRRAFLWSHLRPPARGGGPRFHLGSTAVPGPAGPAPRGSRRPSPHPVPVPPARPQMLTKGLHPRTAPHPAAASSDSERLACACPSRAGLPLMSTLGSRPARRGAGPTMAPKLRTCAPGPGRASKPPNSPSRMHMRSIGDASEGFARLSRAIPSPAPPPPPRGALRPRRGCPRSHARPR
jgi:hypothetical protein